ncbi:DUF3817 domain-containing protein [Streptomyces malaysiensis]|uniref:DUF3817 domain-containing protein n=1 Tax=Streptomyces malaysiensis subsp. samsunensis TaxID=459658 RepID=A0A9X2LWX3_STRMQ|nr:DUF3817 domain-containing protein [Streptomyces samsunensis]MCQ8832145.1 DUF3817 domain-containing protein [Streptomyces samsunensis]
MTMRRNRTHLKIAAVVELVSLAVLLINLATLRYPAVASLTGPIHGCAYLVAILSVLRDPMKRGTTIALALIPGAGATLALRQLASANEEPTAAARA